MTTGETPASVEASKVAADAALAAADEAIRAAAATAAPGQLTDRAIGPARPATTGRPASADIDATTTVDDAILKLASDLRSIPGIERFGTIRLSDLDRAGPRPIRTLWRVSRDQLDARYGQLTIGELVDRYGGGARPPA